MHCFDQVKAVIFVAALSDFDVMLYEDQVTNRMHDSLTLFAAVCNKRWFREAGMILFLNKTDVFEAKITDPDGKHLTSCFPEYKGDLKSVPEALDYIRHQFVHSNNNQRKVIYTHFTCATNTNNIHVVFNAVTDIISKEMFGLCNIYRA